MDQNNLIVMTGQEGNPPVTPTPLQSAMTPYVPFIEIFWWAVWIGAFIYVATHYIVRPLLKK